MYWRCVPETSMVNMPLAGQVAAPHPMLFAPVDVEPALESVCFCGSAPPSDGDCDGPFIVGCVADCMGEAPPLEALPCGEPGVPTKAPSAAPELGEAAAPPAQSVPVHHADPGA